LVCAISFACSSSTRRGAAPATTRPTSTPPAPSVGPSGSSVPGSVGKMPLTRPIITIRGCTPSWARAGHTSAVLFARPSPKRTVQVIGDPARGAGGPYAIVERFFENARRYPVSGSTVDINGQRAWVYVGVYGQGAVEWTLADGTESYIRTRGFDRAGLVSLARALRPRRVQSPVAGFDLASPAPSRRVILGETAGTVEGDAVSSLCRQADGSTLTVSALRGNPVFQYGVALDALPLPDIGQRGDTVVIVFGPKPAATAALTSVHNATPQQWALLLRGYTGHP
jgi:hypothetical protein